MGIDGYKSETVEQTGTDSDCSKGVPSYYAWYEFFPQPSFVVSSLTIQPGDRMAAQISYSDRKFTVTIYGRNHRRILQQDRGSAVGGAQIRGVGRGSPTSTTGIQPLSDLGTVLFGDDTTSVPGSCYATMDGETGPISSFANIYEITMVSLKGATESVPSALSSDGSSFSATWVSK